MNEVEEVKGKPASPWTFLIGLDEQRIFIVSSLPKSLETWNLKLETPPPFTQKRVRGLSVMNRLLTLSCMIKGIKRGSKVQRIADQK